MKRIILITLLFISLNVIGQTKYFIINVVGEIKNKETGQLIKKGDVIDKDDKLLFESKKGKLMLISENRDKFLIKKPKRVKENEEFITSEIAMAVKSRAALVTRSGGAIEDAEIKDLKSYFGEDVFTIIGDSLNLPLNQNIYPLNADQFIVFYYNVDDKQVAKKIGYNDNVLQIDKSKLIEGQEIDESEINNLTVYRYIKSSQETDFITEFSLSFVDSKSIIEEFKTLIPILQGQNLDRNGIKDYMKEYYYDFYGITDKRLLDAFTESVLVQSGI